MKEVLDNYLSYLSFKAGELRRVPRVVMFEVRLPFSSFLVKGAWKKYAAKRKTQATLMEAYGESRAAVTQ